MQIKLKTVVLIAVGLTFCVVLLGAYTRLKDAGLGCPDWPGCYGRLIAPPVNANLSSLDVHKAWIEMIHRYAAGTLGILVFYICLKTMRSMWLLSIVLLSTLMLQGLLGMWTVTLRLYPLVVMAHLLGGLTILSLLWLLYLRLKYHTGMLPPATITTPLQICSSIAIIVLSTQIMLGGWTSANYAALVCADFPTCQGQLWPTMDWLSAFNFYKVGIFDSPGLALENTARVTIQMAHRLGALLTTILLGILSYQLFKTKNNTFKFYAKLLTSLLSVQLILGISNVLARLPLTISLAHNAVAALLLLCLIAIRYTQGIVVTRNKV